MASLNDEFARLIPSPEPNESTSIESMSQRGTASEIEDGTNQDKDLEERLKFNWKKLWAFTGPGFLMSIAYLDPGNIESDLQSGAVAQYKLLWVLLSAHFLGFVLQRLSARLGVVSARHMAEMAYEFYPTIPRVLLWLMIEIAIIGSDMQEVIGTAIAFYLLSNGAIPLFVGVLITMTDTFTFLFLDTYGIRKLEMVFGILIAIMGVTFGYEFFIVNPNKLSIVKGMFLPWCADCGQKEFLQGVSIVGAVIMPHNLYLHSALVKSRSINRKHKKEVTEANFYYFIESGLALLCSFFINMFVVTVFAEGLFKKTNADIRDSCDQRHGIPDPTVFPYNNNTVEVDIYRGGMFLGCEFGLIPLYVWGIGIMAAGQSSTMTGTYSGQFVMEGFLQIKWPRWKRVLITRSIALVPTLSLALIAKGVENLTGMNDLLNCVQMIQLPFALLPIITFTSHRDIMHEYKSSRPFQIFAIMISIVVISINLYFSTDYILSNLGGAWYVWVLMIIACILYVVFVSYLALICLQATEILPATWTDKLPLIGLKNKEFRIDAPWKNPDIETLPDRHHGSHINYGTSTESTSRSSGLDSL
uniref:Uncharacterized protein n=1 Tax=Acrobeloides nanus TaxID=290746 RepID=A0A914ELP4_9BILA